MIQFDAVCADSIVRSDHLFVRLSRGQNILMRTGQPSNSVTFTALSSLSGLVDISLVGDGCSNVLQIRVIRMDSRLGRHHNRSTWTEGEHYDVLSKEEFILFLIQ